MERADKTVLQERISRIEVVKVPTFSRQEGVEVVKKVFEERISERVYERCEVIDVLKISHQANVEAVENILQERNSVRSCEQSEVIDVTKISSQGPSLLRIVEQMIDVTEISEMGGEVWLLGDTRHEPVSRISVRTRELNRIVSLFETVKERMYRKMLGAGSES